MLEFYFLAEKKNVMHAPLHSLP